jgi:DNA-binding XRE family transcriptional regulator
MENPIKTVRTRASRTIKEFAHDCGVHEQAVLLNEQGVYPHILPSVLDHMRSIRNDPQYELDYKMFVRDRRRHNGARFDFAGQTTLGPPEAVHPVVAFRLKFDMSRMKFAKLFCIHPAELDRLEKGKKHGLSEQFKLAMKDAGLPGNVLSELEFRCEEYASGEWVSERRGA